MPTPLPSGHGRAHERNSDVERGTRKPEEAGPEKEVC
jgi:hypothetical protein